MEEQSTENVEMSGQNQMDIMEDVSLETGEHIERSKDYDISTYCKNICALGLITFGGPMSHIGVFRKKFVTDMHCISEDKFLELMSICQSLPGPTSTQLLIAISIYATKSFWGGLYAFLIFSGPTFIAMYIAALASDIVALEQVNLVLPGLRITAIAVIAQAFEGFVKKIADSAISLAICFISALIFILRPQTSTIFGLFLIAGIIGYFLSRNQQPNAPRAAASDGFSDRFQGIFFGKKNIIIFIVILTFTFITASFQQEIPKLLIFNTFFKIGSLVIGGGHVILPLMYSEFAQTGYLTEEDYFNGFSLISICPGPMFNLSVYIGALFENGLLAPFLGSLCAFVGLYLPCFLFLLFVLPQWQQYREQAVFQKIISTVCSVSVGLILAAIFILGYQCLSIRPEPIWPVLVFFLAIGSYVLLRLNVPILATFFLGDVAYIIIKHYLELGTHSFITRL